ncbi:MAG TPA: L-histidine N(alpha)-methyltransferase [Verrucomicrobiae bacterium]|nr:L-histidine N(alpha)-methyltransferase [Verrucomicrobiae bacterium]
MLSAAGVTIHRSQFPESVHRDLIESLRTRQVNHKFHYDSIKQTNKWLALHEAYSPSRHDADCSATYGRAFRAAAQQLRAQSVHVVGLGCGGGQKDTQLLRVLKARRKAVSYTPADVSVAMTLVARRQALRIVRNEKCFPFVCDFATASDLPSALTAHTEPRASRLFTFFGMIPNFEPRDILPKLGKLIRPPDTLLFSANLAPGLDYAAGVQKILPQYDNELTREWLLTFLLDLGVEREDGELRFGIECGAAPLRRVVARFHFKRMRRIAVNGQKFAFERGDKIRLFFSYRYTPELLRQRLARHGLQVTEQWITKSGEEGVFLCRRQ